MTDPKPDDAGSPHYAPDPGVPWPLWAVWGLFALWGGSYIIRFLVPDLLQWLARQQG